MLPLRLGSPEQFSVVRDFLASAGYTEQTVCERLGLEGLHQYLNLSPRNGAASTASVEVSDGLDLLIRLFLAGAFVSRDLVGSFLPGAVRKSMEALGILSADSAAPERCYSPVILYPVKGLYIASNRWSNPDGSPFQMLDDYVFPGIHPLTHDFLEILPQDPCDKLLDLCSGTRSPLCGHPHITLGRLGLSTLPKERPNLRSSTAC